MKRKIKFPIGAIIYIICGALVGVVIWEAITSSSEIRLFPHSETDYTYVEITDNIELTLLAYSVLQNIRDEDFAALSRVVHPQFGLVFTPYSTINLATDRRFSVAEVAAFAGDTTTYIWGIRNGSGEPIALTPQEYLEQFVSADDFLDSAIVGINQIVRTGNALENIKEVFPEVKFVDFHLTGSAEDAIGFDDWRSLRLGFEEYRGELRLVLVLHSTWTA